jgi:hypothetical protein
MSVRDDLKAYVDGELDAVRMEQVRKALAEDPELAREAEALRQIGAAIRRHARRPEAAGAAEALRRLEAPRPRVPWRGLSLAVAGVAVLMVAVLAVVRPGAQDAGELAAPAAREPANLTMEAPAAPPAVGPDMHQMAVPPGREAVAGEVAHEPGAAPPLGTVIDQAVAARDRLIVRNGSLFVRVADVRKAYDDATRIAQRLGGFVESSSDARGEAVPSAELTLRVPAAAFGRALRDLAALGEVLRRQTSGLDVTGQVADLEARLRVMRQEEEQLLAVLRTARNVREILEVRDRLARVRSEIESLESQTKTLRRLATLSTIQLSLTQRQRALQPSPPGDWIAQTWASAVNLLAWIWRGLVQAGIYALILAPVWAPLVLAAWWLWRRLRAPSA